MFQYHQMFLSESEFHPARNSEQQQIASLLICLQAVLRVSQSAIQEIADDLFDVDKCAEQIRQTIENIFERV